MNISKRQFSKLPKFSLEKSLNNIEATFRFINIKDKWGNKLYLLKCLYDVIGPNFSNKLFTVNELIGNRDVINIEQLVIPERLVSLDGDIIGYIFPYIESDNFQSILQNFDYTNKQKIDMFKQIDEILDKMRIVRENTGVKDFS